MAAKTYPRYPLRIFRMRDPVLGGTSDNEQLGNAFGIVKDGFPLTNNAFTGQLIQATLSNQPIVAFALQDAVDKDGAALVQGDEIATYLAYDTQNLFLEGNLLAGAPGAQIDHVLAQGDLFEAVTLRYDPNYLGAGLAGYYFDFDNPGSGVGAGGSEAGQGRVMSFINSRVQPNEVESVSREGDTNAVVRVQLILSNYLVADAPSQGS